MSTVPIIAMKQSMQYYLSLFTSQYRMSAKLNAWQTVLLTPIDDLTTCMEQFNAAYDLDVAIGNQLDVLGQLIGVSRTLPFQPSKGVSPILDDTTYRLLLRATLARNTWNGKTSSLYPIWQSLLPGATLLIQDNQNMTCNIIYGGDLSSIETDLITHGMIVPRPEGVLYNYGASTGEPFFGFDRNDAVVAGFDTGNFT